MAKIELVQIVKTSIYTELYRQSQLNKSDTVYVYAESTNTIGVDGTLNVDELALAIISGMMPIQALQRKST